MPKYYKGYLFLKSDISYPSKTIYLYKDEILEFSDSEFLKEYNLLSKKDQFLVKTSLKNEKVECLDFFGKMFHKDEISMKDSRLSLIYEIICDEDDNLYAKELLTGVIFPIMGKKTVEYSIVSKGKHRFISNMDGEDRYIEFISGAFENKYGKTWYCRESDLKDDCFYAYPDREYEYMMHSDHFYWKHYAKEYAIQTQFDYVFSNLQRGECYILNGGNANELEIDEYKRKYQKERRPLFKRNFKSFQDKVRDYAKLNVFDKEITPKQEEVHERKSVNELGRIMDDIEYSLLKLKNHSDTLYNKYSKVYEELCSNDGLKHGTLDKSTLESLKAGILLSLEFDGNKGMNILDYLEYMKNEYLENTLNNMDIKTKITINDLDRIMELYLQTQDEYDLIIQRKIIRNISLLYFFEIYENKDNLDDFDLEKSYIKEVLKTILVCIDMLRDKGLLEKNILIDLSNPTLKDVLELIKNIEFKKKEKIKVLSNESSKNA